VAEKYDDEHEDEGKDWGESEREREHEVSARVGMMEVNGWEMVTVKETFGRRRKMTIRVRG
jgi:DNA gyrase/topoisomerase IV subunit A